MASVTALVVTIFSGTAAAVPIVYGNFSGTTVDYINVAEDDKALFGAPIITGDTLVFSPLEFEAQANGAGDAELLDGTVNFIIDAKAGNAVNSFQISEAGAYSLLGAGTAATQVGVAVAIIINILEVDNVAVNLTPFGANQTLFTDDLSGGQHLATVWSASALFDLQSLAFTNLGVTGDITKVSISINNALFAISESGTISFIDKKAINGFTITVPVPEPASLALLAAGTLLVGYGRFRRRAR